MIVVCGCGCIAVHLYVCICAYNQFVGGPTFESVFANYENPGFHELPGDLPYSELHLFSKYQGYSPLQKPLVVCL